MKSLPFYITYQVVKRKVTDYFRVISVYKFDCDWWFYYKMYARHKKKYVKLQKEIIEYY